MSHSLFDLAIILASPPPRSSDGGPATPASSVLRSIPLGPTSLTETLHPKKPVHHGLRWLHPRFWRPQAFYKNSLSLFVQLHIIMAERDRQRTGGPVSFHPRIFICSKIVVTVVNLISHKPRFHAGLRAIRQSNGFIVGNTLLAFSSAFIMRRLVQNLRFSQYFCNLFPPYRVVLPRSVRGKSCRKVVKSCSGPESARIWHKIGTHRMPRKLPKTIPHYCELETTWFHTTLLTWTDLYRNKYSISREDVQVNAYFVTELNFIPYI